MAAWTVLSQGIYANALRPRYWIECRRPGAINAREDDMKEAARTHDMIVPLLALPEESVAIEKVRAKGVTIRPARSFELTKTVEFVARFWEMWVDEVHQAFGGSPNRVFLATQEREPVGFAAYDVGFRGLFGPTGVHPDLQGQGIGAALLLRTLTAMREQGYLYAIIGAVGPADFYRRHARALSLPTDWPSFIRPDPDF